VGFWIATREVNCRPSFEASPSVCAILWLHFDCHHHALVFVFDNVAVKYEAPDDFRIGERNDELGLARFPIPRWRNAEGVAEAVDSFISARRLIFRTACLNSLKPDLSQAVL
jgi:hypothetical protein